MNKFSMYRITNASLLKNYIFGAFIRYKAGTLQDALIIHFWDAMLLARRWPVLHKLLSIQLAQCSLAWARALRAPSMQAERLMTSTQGHASTSRCTRPK